FVGIVVGMCGQVYVDEFADVWSLFLVQQGGEGGVLGPHFFFFVVRPPEIFFLFLRGVFFFPGVVFFFGRRGTAWFFPGFWVLCDMAGAAFPVPNVGVALV
ncbi:hypothetical protein, partial [Klebsiella pneumoniae]|uniref:hypothetical protein n=1 Tax=Klebsiella pneumoniae TaxID=573 RepID=UPI00272F5A66